MSSALDSRIFAGSGMQVMRSINGNVLTFLPKGKWAHPWFTTLSFRPLTKSWFAGVLPGFVNGIAPVYPTTVGAAPARTLKVAAVNKVDITNKAATIDSPLYDSPEIALSLRAIGWDDLTGQNAIPAFFKALNVNPAPPVDDGDGTQLNANAQVLPKNNRLLRACDIYITQPRYALTASTALGDPSIEAFSTIQSLGIAAPSAAQRLTITATSNYTGATAAQIDPASGDYEEPTFDTLPISTVYLLSPPGAAPGSAPTGSWQPYVQHHAFWNLGWAQQTNVQQTDFAPTELIIPTLGGAVAQPLINEELAPLNDSASQLLNFLAGQSLAGTFWSMGGCSALPAPAVTTPVDNFGLNKLARNTAAVKTANAAAKQPPLDPDFPYSGLTFPAKYL